MFETLTASARQVLRASQDAAVSLGHDFIGAEHLLLGVLGDDDGVVIRVLDRLGVDPGELRRAVADAAG